MTSEKAAAPDEAAHYPPTESRDHAREVEHRPDDRPRRWYHLRPERRRRTDLIGFNATWWALLWVIVIVVLVEPWWW
jgi:hypothetical protein